MSSRKRRERRLLKEVEAALMGPPPSSFAGSISEALKAMEENEKRPRPVPKLLMSQAEWDDIVKWGAGDEPKRR